MKREGCKGRNESHKYAARDQRALSTFNEQYSTKLSMYYGMPSNVIDNYIEDHDHEEYCECNYGILLLEAYEKGISLPHY